MCVKSNCSTVQFKLTQCMRTCLVAKSCLTLCDPMDCSPPGSSGPEIFQARILEWVDIFSSKNLYSAICQLYLNKIRKKKQNRKKPMGYQPSGEHKFTDFNSAFSGSQTELIKLEEPHLSTLKMNCMYIPQKES